MWFSYQGDENWIPVAAARVKEIMVMNKAGKKAPNLKEEAIQIAAPVVIEKSFDYENVVGQDSLTRLDERSKNKNQNRNQKNNRNNTQTKRERVPNAEKAVQPKPQNPNQQRPQQQSARAQNPPKPQQPQMPKNVVAKVEGLKVKAES
uniref:hypothetical protein n=1 Tax=Devosia albogilva TaxID=429726 RepID=UPI0036DD73DE